jgi:glutathione S-transferase
MSTVPYRIFGGNASPYSRKLRAILRYRRLPHVWVLGTADSVPEIAQVKPRLVPVLRLPDTGEYRVDSTPLAYLLEQRHPDARSIIPPDPADAFICHLIEDFADEWLTKLMFHYRWVEDETAAWASHWIIWDAMPGMLGAQHDQAAKYFHDRQRSRMPMVGCTPANAPVIESGYALLLDALAGRIGGTRFLFGSRPSLADFALYGQLAQLTIDPLPLRICRERAPGVEAWVIGLDDAGGIEGQWDVASTAALREALLAMIGSDYLPFLKANAAAVRDGRDQVELEIRGLRYTQPPFDYQTKCHADILHRWSALPQSARDTLTDVLDRSGCLPFLVSAT